MNERVQEALNSMKQSKEVPNNNEKVNEKVNKKVDERGTAKDSMLDLDSDEARAMMARQTVQGYTDTFGYMEKSGCFDIYLPVPNGTKPKDIKVELHPDRMRVSVKGLGVVTEGEFEGRVTMDGSYWLMSDLSLDSPSGPKGSSAVRQGPQCQDQTCIQIYLEKRRPYDKLWRSVYYLPPEPEDDGVPLVNEDEEDVEVFGGSAAMDAEDLG
ncbi:unnamed protein product [Choristocarpus tenellus]